MSERQTEFDDLRPTVTTSFCSNCLVDGLPPPVMTSFKKAPRTADAADSLCRCLMRCQTQADAKTAASPSTAGRTPISLPKKQEATFCAGEETCGTCTIWPKLDLTGAGSRPIYPPRKLVLSAVVDRIVGDEGGHRGHTAAATCAASSNGHLARHASLCEMDALRKCSL